MPLLAENGTIIMDEMKLKDDRKNKPIRVPLSPRLRFKVLQRDGFTCQYCGRTGTERELEIDHIVPYSKGGTNNLDNLMVACKECNRGKLADDILINPRESKVVEEIVCKKASTPKEHKIDYSKHKDNIKSFLAENPSIDQITEYVEYEAQRQAKIRKDFIKITEGQTPSNIGNLSPRFIDFCVNYSREHSENVKRWSEQTENPLLQQLAKECIVVGNIKETNAGVSSKYSASFISFAKNRMENQGIEIRKWKNDSNPILAQICREIIDASGVGE